MRLASTLCLAGALLLLPTPWYEFTFLRSPEGVSGLQLCTFIWQEKLGGMKPLELAMIVLLGLYPFALITGIIFSLTRIAPRRRAGVVGAAASVGMIALSALYVELIFVNREAVNLAFQINGWFYLSHALCLTGLILSVVEFRRKPSTG